MEKQLDERKKAQNSFSEKAGQWEEIKFPSQLLDAHDLLAKHQSMIQRGMNGEYRTLESLCAAIEELRSIRKQLREIALLITQEIWDGK